MRRSALIAIVALIIAVPAMAANQVYRWKDAKGIVHFADAPPAHGIKYKVVNLKTGAVHTPKPKATTTTEDTSDGAANGAEGVSSSDLAKAKSDIEGNSQRICNNSQAQIKLLAGNMVLTEAPGSDKIMSADERARRLAKAREIAKQYCK